MASRLDSLITKRGAERLLVVRLQTVQDTRKDIPLQSPDLIAVNALGQFADHPRVAALRDFITGWYVSYLSIDSTRGQPEAGPQERLSRNGDNLANVIQYLGERHPDRLTQVFETLRSRVPRIEKVLAEAMPDGRLLLTIKDAPFDNPILARFASDGTLKMLAYLVLLYDPSPPPFIGIEEPENFLHPRLLYGLAEECRAAAERGQLLVTTHSPFFYQCFASGRSAGALPRRRRIHPSSPRGRNSGGSRIHERGRPAWSSLAGRALRGGRSADEPRGSILQAQERQMKAEHLEVLVEEPSMEAFLLEVLPRMLNGQATFAIHPHQGKSDLIAKLGARLRGYAKWLPPSFRVVVLVDRDDDNCVTLKRRMEQDAQRAGLLTRTASAGAPWQVVNRLAIEELEAWFFGEWSGVRKAYPKASKFIPGQAPYRQSDAITGGTWEALERVLRAAEYFSGGLMRKVEAATAVGRQFDPGLARSPSLIALWGAVSEAVA